MQEEELKYLLALKEVKGVGGILAKYLLREVGTAQEIFKLSPGKLLKIPRITEKIAKDIHHFADFQSLEEEIEWCENEKIKIITFQQTDYPKRLMECHDAPLFLYVKGSADLNNQKMVCIVGTRNSTEYGRFVTEKIIDFLQTYSVTIVSGMALGIDGIAHRKSLEKNIPTIGVLGHSLAQIYPPQHRHLADEMLKNGALVTEFSRRTTFDKNNFPMRNRIVAGMCDVTILVESAEKGGSMITAEIAHAYGRDVMTVPGRWTDNKSQGNHKLIKQLKAQMITQPEDIADLLGWKEKSQLVIEDFYDKKTKYQNLDADEMKIVAFMNVNEATSFDTLHYSTEIAVPHLSSLLLSMEFKGIIRALPGKRFQLK